MSVSECVSVSMCEYVHVMCVLVVVADAPPIGDQHVLPSYISTARSWARDMTIVLCVCVCACVCACVRACVRVCVRVWSHTCTSLYIYIWLLVRGGVAYLAWLL